MFAINITSAKRTARYDNLPALQQNAIVYDDVLSILGDFRQFCPEVVLHAVGCVANFAHFNHPGRFADGSLENVLLEVGANIKTDGNELDSIYTPGEQDGRRHVLHVAKTVVGVGGLARMVRHWVNADSASRHSLVLTEQSEWVVSDWLYDAVRSRGGDVVVLPQQAGLLKKAKWLRELGRHFDYVIFHATGHEHDVLPTVAFADRRGPPVAIVDHGDHLFWLGSSVTDLVISLRHIGARLSESRRFNRKHVLLPIPLAGPSSDLSRSNARAALNISDKQILLLSVGRKEKYRPGMEHNFLRTAQKILAMHPDAHVYAVGASHEQACSYISGQPSARLHLVGEVENLDLYWAAADIYLEGFPFGSQTALLEAALAGIPVVPAYAPPCELLVANDDAVSHLISNPKTEQEFCCRVGALIRDSTARRELGSSLREQVAAEHTGEGWRRCLDNVYAVMGQLSHDPQPIPRATGMTDPVDVALAEFGMSSYYASGRRMDPISEVREILVGIAWIAKNCGDYVGSFRILRAFVLTYGFDRLCVTAIMKLLPQWSLGHHKWRVVSSPDTNINKASVAGR